MVCHKERERETWDSLDMLQGSFGPFRPNVEKSLKMSSRGLGLEKSKMESKKSQNVKTKKVKVGSLQCGFWLRCSQVLI